MRIPKRKVIFDASIVAACAYFLLLHPRFLQFFFNAWGFKTNDDQHRYLILVSVYSTAIIALIWIYVCQTKMTQTINSVRYSNVIAAALLGCALVFVSPTISHVGRSLGLLRSNKLDYAFVDSISDHPQLVFAVTVVLAPIFEELIFRGNLFQVVKRSFGAISAVVLTAFLFGSLHYHQGFLGVASASIVGLALGAIRIFGHSIIYPVIAHASLNAVVYFVLFVFAIGR